MASFAVSSVSPGPDEPPGGFPCEPKSNGGLGGTKSYIVNGAMRSGFAMMAWPADYGQSGVMTFLIAKDGVLREKDLGPDTGTLAPAIEAFDPDSTWETP